MSKKRPVYVSIPVGHVCITESEFLHMHKQLIHFQMELRLRTSECCSLDDEVEGLKKQLAEAEKKIEELEKDVKDKGDSVLYWFNKYQSLCNELEKVKSNAEAKTT